MTQITYGAIVEFFFQAQKLNGKRVFAIGVTLDLTVMDTSNLPTPVALLEDMDLSKIILAYSSMTGNFILGGETINLLANAFMVFRNRTLMG